jgi:16S rRNA (uracil1498-N3)-methyltransferase
MVEPLFHKDNLVASVGGTVILDGPEGKHAVAVRRLRVGEAIQLSDGKGQRIRGVVSALAQNALTVSVEEVLVESLPSRQLVLVQALAKGDRDEMAIQAATELGVSSIIPWQAGRSISRWDGPKLAKGQARWQLIVSEAAKQSLRAFTPAVEQIVDTKELVNNVKDFDLVLVLDISARVLVTELELPKSGRIALVVGPEGGIDQIDLDLLVAQGAVLLSLGSNVLRTSTAGPALVAAILLGNI